eukprot:NODE_263_length_2061_cov_363.915507_g179_i0.p1 GENE.NODE_263_length_2061_cov_363.915507_g179_i0~~NODE_263_length_2061_cov_363.915507_g179_i0.p1  ORF type:complete len:553 (+),score=123.89 NODE_263_length_2061_cov_363.915507_g179_i0:56-1714(+)
MLRGLLLVSVLVEALSQTSCNEYVTGIHLKALNEWTFQQELGCANAPAGRGRSRDPPVPCPTPNANQFTGLWKMCTKVGLEAQDKDDDKDDDNDDNSSDDSESLPAVTGGSKVSVTWDADKIPAEFNGINFGELQVSMEFGGDLEGATFGGDDFGVDGAGLCLSKTDPEKKYIANAASMSKYTRIIDGQPVVVGFRGVHKIPMAAFGSSNLPLGLTSGIQRMVYSAVLPANLPTEMSEDALKIGDLCFAVSLKDNNGAIANPILGGFIPAGLPDTVCHLTEDGFTEVDNAHFFGTIPFLGNEADFLKPEGRKSCKQTKRRQGRGRGRWPSWWPSWASGRHGRGGIMSRSYVKVEFKGNNFMVFDKLSVTDRRGRNVRAAIVAGTTAVEDEDFGLNNVLGDGGCYAAFHTTLMPDEREGFVTLAVDRNAKTVTLTPATPATSCGGRDLDGIGRVTQYRVLRSKNAEGPFKSVGEWVTVGAGSSLKAHSSRLSVNANKQPPTNSSFPVVMVTVVGVTAFLVGVLVAAAIMALRQRQSKQEVQLESCASGSIVNV